MLAAAVSCVYPYEVPELSNEQEILVVDGSIVVGKEARVTMSKMNEFYYFVLPEEWWVEDEAGTRYTPVRGGDRVDLSNAPTDRSYRMVIRKDGKTYFSSFEKGIDQPEITEVNFTADQSRVYCNVSLNESESGTGYVSLSFEEIWHFHAPFQDLYYLEKTAYGYQVSARDIADETYYWCWRYRPNPTEALVDVSHLGGTAKDYPLTVFTRSNDRNHGDYTIKVTARSVSEAEYRFRKNLESAYSSGHNLFTPNPGEIAGNVACEEDPSERVLGYVTLSLAASKEAHLDSRYLVTLEYETSGFLNPEWEEFWHLYNDMAYRPIVEDPAGPVGDALAAPILWGPLRCINCVAAGGTLEKPSFR